MTKAEEQALKAYPKMSRITEPEGTLVGDGNAEKREGFVKGYKQGKQELIIKINKWIEDNFSLYEGISGYHVAKELKQAMKDE